MKRKVVLHGPSTLTISLPSKWAKQYRVERGAELDVNEEGDSLRISTNGTKHRNKITIDVSNLDRSSIFNYIRSAYRKGFDEIKVKYNNIKCIHLRLGRKIFTANAIQHEVSRLVGVEIIQQENDYCTIKDISSSSSREFDAVLRRIFLLLLEMGSQIVSGSKNHDANILNNVELKHDIITKLISYCIRLLNKRFHKQHANSSFYHHILASIDKIVDTLKYSARDIISLDMPLSPESIDIIDNIRQSLELYYNLNYKFKTPTILKIAENRDIVIKKLKKLNEDTPLTHNLILIHMGNILEILQDIVESVMSVNLMEK